MKRNQKKKIPTEKTHENVRLPVDLMKLVRVFCDENKMKLGGFFEMAGYEKLENAKAKKVS